MTLEEELRIFELKYSQDHHHKTEEGRNTLEYMRHDLIERYFQGDENAFMKRYQLFRLREYST